MENIKGYQQYLLFYYSPNKMFLKTNALRALVNISLISLIDARKTLGQCISILDTSQIQLILAIAFVS